MSQWKTWLDRWDSAQVARQQGPRELGFEADHNGFTGVSSGFAAMKLFPGREGS